MEKSNKSYYKVRYTRQEALLGKQAQNTLSKKTAAIVGLGALGTNTANLLARAGINLKLIDFDDIDITNLQRQTLYNETHIKKPKVQIALAELKKINSETKIEAFNEKLTNKNLKLLDSDLVIDCTDNLTARFLINDYCYNNLPWIHTAAVKCTGVIFNILPGKPCLRCLYTKNTDIDNCNELGILNSTPALTSSIAATQAIKILLNQQPEERLIRINIWNNEIEKIIVKKTCEKCQKHS